MEPRSEGDSLARVRTVTRALLLWAVLVFCRLVHLQVVQHEDLARQADSQQTKQVEILAPRGKILDRNGRPLAMSLPVDSIAVDPVRIPDPYTASSILAGVLNLNQSELLGKILVGARANRHFLWIKRKIEPEESERLTSYGFDWVEFRKESRRFYPNGPLAANVIGSVGHDEQGNAGFEMAFNDELSGHSGEGRMLSDVRRQSFGEVIDNQAEAGKEITLTIDEQIQFVAERALERVALETHAGTGTVVALDPRTGSLLAMASYPSFDPNEPAKGDEDLQSRGNLCVSTPFEPGSVFKVFTLSAALETTNLRPETPINCGGGIINLFGRVIHDTHSYGSLSFADVLAKSSNIGAIQIGLRVGEEKLYDYLLRFGFGRTSGLGLPGESAGMVRKLRQWTKSSIGSVAMGHEVSVTALQLAQACSVVANDGKLIPPRIILKKQRPTGEIDVEPVRPARRALDPRTALTMRSLMEGVVLHGTGRRAKMSGYTSAGKTGTAQLYDFDARAWVHRYNASFMGFAPVNNPAIVVVVTLYGTSGGTAGYGGPVAAPVFREVASAALRVLNVPKDLPETPASRKEVPIPDDDLPIADLSAPAADAGMPVEANTAPGVSVTSPAPAGLVPATYVGIAGRRAPDFRGRTLRSVLEEAAVTGVAVEVFGKGIAKDQAPAPGNVLSPGEKVRVQFGR
ncbi:MAG: penicillin-binding protein [Acidobacteria bacterium]|nr:penicillin-binding protein [Acidobacteriota bacterium]